MLLPEQDAIARLCCVVLCCERGKNNKICYICQMPRIVPRRRTIATQDLQRQRIETFGAEAALSSPRKRPIARVHPPFHQRHGAALDADVAHTGQVVERRNAGRTRVAGTLRAGDEDVHNDLCADRAHPHGAQRHRLLQGMTPV
jgi:hypothetical protein